MSGIVLVLATGCQAGKADRIAFTVSVPKGIVSELPSEGELGWWITEMEPAGIDATRSLLGIVPTGSVPRITKDQFPFRLEIPVASLSLAPGKRYFVRVVYSRALHIRRDVDQASAEENFVYGAGGEKPLNIRFSDFRSNKKLDLATPVLLKGSLDYSKKFTPPEGARWALGLFEALGKYNDGRPGLNAKGRLLAAMEVSSPPKEFNFNRKQLRAPDYHGRVELFLFDCQGEVGAVESCVTRLHADREANPMRVFPAYDTNFHALDSGERNRNLRVLSRYDAYDKKELP